MRPVERPAEQPDPRSADERMVDAAARSALAMLSQLSAARAAIDAVAAQIDGQMEIIALLQDRGRERRVGAIAARAELEQAGEQAGGRKVFGGQGRHASAGTPTPPPGPADGSDAPPVPPIPGAVAEAIRTTPGDTAASLSR